MADPTRYPLSVPGRLDPETMAAEIRALSPALPGFLGIVGGALGSELLWAAALFSAPLSAADRSRLTSCAAAHSPPTAAEAARLRAVAQARAALAASQEAQARTDRAIALAAMDSDNALRAWVTSFVAATAAATSLADLKTRVAQLGGLPQITPAAVRSALDARAGTADADPAP